MPTNLPSRPVTINPVSPISTYIFLTNTALTMLHTNYGPVRTVCTVDELLYHRYSVIGYKRELTGNHYLSNVIRKWLGSIVMIIRHF